MKKRKKEKHFNDSSFFLVEEEKNEIKNQIYSFIDNNRIEKENDLNTDIRLNFEEEKILGDNQENTNEINNQHDNNRNNGEELIIMKKWKINNNNEEVNKGNDIDNNNYTQRNKKSKDINNINNKIIKIENNKNIINISSSKEKGENDLIKQTKLKMKKNMEKYCTTEVLTKNLRNKKIVPEHINNNRYLINRKSQIGDSSNIRIRREGKKYN